MDELQEFLRTLTDAELSRLLWTMLAHVFNAETVAAKDAAGRNIGRIRAEFERREGGPKPARYMF